MSSRRTGNSAVKQQSKKDIIDQKEKEPVKRKKTLKEKVNEKILSAVDNLKKLPVCLNKKRPLFFTALSSLKAIVPADPSFFHLSMICQIEKEAVHVLWHFLL